jgi:photosystem II stability/assembly factor-like uncharacterized protein
MKLVALLFFLMFWTELCKAQDFRWKELDTPVKASLRGLSPVSDQICWASGSNGTWLKTMDGGDTWESGVIAGLDSVDFRSIQAFDENTAVVASAGQPAVIFRTDDGGETWDKVHQEGSEAFFDGIAFVDKNTGYVIGDPVKGVWMILETLDGGKSWKTLDSLPSAEIGEAAFAASASSMIATKGGLIFGTGGPVSNLYSYDFKRKIWEKLKTPMIQGEASQGIFALVETSTSILAVGGDYTKLDFTERNAFRFSDQNFTFPLKAPSGYRSGIAFFSKVKLTIAVGPSGSDYSFDDGMAWEEFSTIGYHSVKISIEGESVWASGSEGRIGLLIH